MGPALRLILQLLICGLSLASGLAPLKASDDSPVPRDPSLNSALSAMYMNETSSEKQLCDVGQRNCTLRLHGKQIPIDSISACNLNQFPRLRELKVRGPGFFSLEESDRGSFYESLDEFLCGLPNLTYFSVVDVTIKRDVSFSIKTRCPKSCSSNIRHLQLSQDSIDLIPPCIGFSLSRLNKLDLSGNLITSVPSLEVMKRFVYRGNASSQESQDAQVRSPLQIDLSNNSLILLPVDIFPDRNESAIHDEQGLLHAHINLENNPNLMCLPPSSAATFLETERYIPECCCNPLKSEFLGQLTSGQSDCQSSNATASLTVAQKSVDDDGIPTLKLSLSISGMSSSCRLGQPVMMQYSGHAQPRFLQKEQDILDESCTCQHSFDEQALDEESSDLVKGFMSFLLNPSVDSFGGSTSIEIEIPYPSVGKFKFCIDKTAVSAGYQLNWEQSQCIELDIDDLYDQDDQSDQKNPSASPPFYSPDSTPPSPFSESDVDPASYVQPSTTTQSNSNSPTHSSPHSSPHTLLWPVLGGGAVILALILLLGLYKYRRKRRQACHRTRPSESASDPGRLELVENGIAADEIPADSRPLELNTNRDLQPEVIATRALASTPDPLSSLAMLFECHHQGSYRSMHVLGTAATPVDDRLDDSVVMGVALDHVNL